MYNGTLWVSEAGRGEWKEEAGTVSMNAGGRQGYRDTLVQSLSDPCYTPLSLITPIDFSKLAGRKLGMAIIPVKRKTR